MTRNRLSFRPPCWAVALAVAGCAAGILLGNWQAGRADEKRAAAAAAKPESLRGELLAGHTMFLQNRIQHGKPGFYVLQPLRIAQGRHVLVNRGWLAASSAGNTPQVATPAGEVALHGLRLERLGRALEAGGPPATGNLRQNVTLEEFAAWSGLALEPLILEQHSALDDGLARDWPRRDAGLEKHQAYSLQWYSLAALSLILLAVLGLRREKPAA